MSYERAQELFDKYENGTATDEEKRLVEKWLINFNNEPTGLSDEKIDRIAKEVWSKLPQSKIAANRRLTLWTKVIAAASVVLALSFSGYLLLHKQQFKQAAYYKNDVAPGHNQATLTLANGKKIILTKGLNGTIAIQGQTRVQVSQNDIVYKTAKSKEIVSYNMLSTERGEQSPYPLILADGTKVWLNAQSSITFPTEFNGKERIVKITGEALFEVKHNSAQPFKVEAGSQTIEDIGTIFNVNAYKDEPKIRTTLIKGSVKINDLVLKPNEQTDGINIRTVNADVYTAWRGGNFHFERDNIQTIMRQLSRWYNIDVVYQGQITNDVFYADISRSRNISAVLKLLEMSGGVNFKIEGRRVTVIE